MSWCEDNDVFYLAAWFVRLARHCAQEKTGQAARRFRLPLPDPQVLVMRRRVVGKAEYLAKGYDQPVASSGGGERSVREVDCARGEMENRMQLGLFADRTSYGNCERTSSAVFFLVGLRATRA